MDYQEALGVLGLSEGASEAEVKTAYREMAQILHPDKYIENRKLAERAEEQFKRLNKARDVLLSSRGRRGAKGGGAKGVGAKGGGARGGGARGSGSGARGGGSSDGGSSDYGNEAQTDRVNVLKARLAGIAAARIQLTTQLDNDLDSRRIAITLLVGGFIGLFLGERFGMRIIDALGGTAMIWGAIQAFSYQPRIRAIQAHLDDLAKQRKKYEAELSEL
jgi:curved DNA-binding protein CbpA